jgi:hypothetical protein
MPAGAAPADRGRSTVSTGGPLGGGVERVDDVERPMMSFTS